MMEEELRELMSRLNSKLESEGNTVCMQQFFNISVLNIIWSMVAGVRFNHDDPEFVVLVANLNATLRLVTATGNIMLAFPFLSSILPKLTGYGEVRKKCIAKFQDLFMVGMSIMHTFLFIYIFQGFKVTILQRFFISPFRIC